ncbi:MAG: ComF family protein [Lachnospiraceae bacterium]|nr:ComF family protein [Lachnospiraceae bacterium]
MKITKIPELLADMLFPRVCPICGDLVPFLKGDICPWCIPKLTYADEPYCMMCGKPVDEDEEFCRDCMKGHHAYDEGRSALIYDEYMSQSIYRFKYNGKREFASFYGRVMYERLEKKIRQWNVDAIVHVPVHKNKLKKRGYDQAYLLARQLSKRTKIPHLKGLIIRRTATKVQKDLSAAQRQNNLKKAFKVTQNVVKLNSILVVDDIYTTGATVDSIARCLKGAGVEKVYFATLCIGRGY